MKSLRLSHLSCALTFAFALNASTASAQVTTFSTDVSAAINAGLAWLDAEGIYNAVPPADCSDTRDAMGLAALALLEKRVSADQTAVAQGYSGASAADKVRLDNIMATIIARAIAGGGCSGNFYAYRDGGDMMALSVYILSGGPNQAGALSGLKAVFDRVIPNQGGGYWCYTDGSCDDSSTTQLVVAGLSAARKVFNSANPLLSDPARLASLDAALVAAKNGYAANGLAGAGCGPAGNLTASERGHGYNAGDCNSLQQTGSGVWIQVNGGADLNNASVQGYLEWIRNRYRYSDISINDWANNSYYYYLWSSSKAYEFLEESGTAPNPGNLTTADLGTLAPGSVPAYGSREVHRSPAADSRVPQRGAGGPGYYNSVFEPARWYYDYAYTLMTHQDAAGHIISPAPGGWDGFGGWEVISNQSYAILVLERSIGGGCADGDGDSTCNQDDNCPITPNPGQEDGDLDGVGNVCDNCPATANGNQGDVDSNGTGDACDNTTAKVKLATQASPGSGKTGVTNITVTGNAFPPSNIAIPPANVNVYLGATCGGVAANIVVATKVTTVIGTTRNVQFKLPAGMAPGPYKLSINGVASNGSFFASLNCSNVTVTP